ncbi:MAG TPA: His/Gly/Thr/Pro-type tRNA ligase C-terminal domain-containing protein, partial [Magnetovibrio sp.]
AEALAAKLNNNVAFGNVVRAFVDKRDVNAGEKRWGWIKKGAPIIVEMGPRDLEQGTVMVTLRTDIYGKAAVNSDEFVANITATLEGIQATLFKEAKAYRDARVRTDITDFAAFKAFFTNETHQGAGFVRAYWDESESSEASLKELAVTVRCLPYDQPSEPGTCVLTGNPATKVAIFAKAY